MSGETVSVVEGKGSCCGGGAGGRTGAEKVVAVVAVGACSGNMVLA